jgi:tetratricopeptide (TPR) repeat protein
MPSQAQQYIDDARRFQKNGNYELAIALLTQASQQKLSPTHELEIQKLLSFNYRKAGNFDMALFHIAPVRSFLNRFAYGI